MGQDRLPGQGGTPLWRDVGDGSELCQKTRVPAPFLFLQDVIMKVNNNGLRA